MDTRFSKMFVCAYDRVAGIAADGKVYCHGSYNSSDEFGACSIAQDPSGDKLISRIFMNMETTVIMDAYGELSAAGNDEHGQVSGVADWTGPFVDVKCEMRHTMALKEDGTVVVCGANDFGQCDVEDWTDITAIETNLFHTVGLKSDGTVVACGSCSTNPTLTDVGAWKDIVQIACSNQHTVGLKSDGTVVACGDDDNGKCQVSGWTDIVKVVCGNYHTVGLKKDGTVVACGSQVKDEKMIGHVCKVSDWTDVKDIFCTDFSTYGLKNDGTLLFVGNNATGVAEATKWTDILYATANQNAVFGIRGDGMVVTCGKGEYSSYEPVKKWKLFQSADTYIDDYETSLTQRQRKLEDSGKNGGLQQKVIKAPGGIFCPGFGKDLLALALVAALAVVALFVPGFGSAAIKENTPAQAETTAPVSYPVAYVTADGGLNLRSEPSQDGQKLTTMPYDACVTVYEVRDGWAYVAYGEYTGWCAENYLRMQ